MFIDNVLGVIASPVGVGVYDFDFGLHFRCSHPYEFSPGTPAVLRIGAIQDYPTAYREKEEWGLRLLNTPQEHVLASELEAWYPHLSDLTPLTQIYDALPEASVIEAQLGWPVFIKGSRQTSRHDPELSIAQNQEQYERIKVRYQEDDILSWQRPVVRQFIQLESVAGQVPGKIRPSLEFRSFWLCGTCVGVGRYWYQVPDYHTPDLEKGLAIAGEAAARLGVPFLVVDFAKTADGEWIVIECNDAQESGLAAIPPQVLWSEVIRLIAARSGKTLCG